MSRIQIDKNSAKRAFDLLDYNNEGTIDIEEILNNMIKLGYDKRHPEAFNLVESLGNNKINYNEFEGKLNELMRQKRDDSGLQRMYDLLIFNPKSQAIDRTLLIKIAEETGNQLNEYEIKYLLNKAGNGKTISLQSFIDFMSS
jgi:Ca2+-binding EF-hand superfamily protein